MRRDSRWRRALFGLVLCVAGSLLTACIEVIPTSAYTEQQLETNPLLGVTEQIHDAALLKSPFFLTQRFQSLQSLKPLVGQRFKFGSYSAVYEPNGLFSLYEDVNGREQFYGGAKILSPSPGGNVLLGEIARNPGGYWTSRITFCQIKGRQLRCLHPSKVEHIAAATNCPKSKNALDRRYVRISSGFLCDTWGPTVVLLSREQPDYVGLLKYGAVWLDAARDNQFISLDLP